MSTATTQQPTTRKPKGAGAVMAGRHEAPDSLDFFPTPPWATRALFEHVAPFASGVVWEPAAGEGHMAAVLAERFDDVWRTDVFDYGGLNEVGSFVGDGADVAAAPYPQPDWIITNPPFRLAVEFFERAIREARCGVALLVRTSWLEGGDRYNRIFAKTPPTYVGVFAERVPMVKGRWDPEASTATSYVWMVWHKPLDGEARCVWIPPGCRRGLTRPDDVKRFAGTAR